MNDVRFRVHHMDMKSRAPVETRSYDIRARADAAAKRRERVVEAAMGLFMSQPFDEVTLQSVADAAEVSLKTVMRTFGSKEGLVTACIAHGQVRENSRRVVAVGDVEGAAEVLAARYEAMLGWTLRMVALSERLPIVRTWIDTSRRTHLAWLAEVFAPWLPASGAERDVRLIQLFGATEVYCWWSARESLGFSRAKVASALRETLRALVARWEQQGGTMR